jgi:ATP-dependent RNA helicase RhlE
MDKVKVLTAITNGVDRTLVFCDTKRGADRLVTKLQREGVKAGAIHGDLSQGAREHALADFMAGKVPVLVATDVAARGLDIEDLPHVVNYELPWEPQDYIHRIGRTARAGATGDAISLVSIDEADLLRGVQRLLKQAIPWTVEEGFVPDRNAEPQPLRGGPPSAHPPRGHHYHHRVHHGRRRSGSGSGARG